MTNFVELYRSYFLATNDSHAHFYEVARSLHESPIAGDLLSFGGDSHQIRIIDQFKGKRPMLFNLECMRAPRRYDLKLFITIILDSNIVSGLHLYRTNIGNMRPDIKQSLKKLLDWLSEYRYDFNPFFYYAESFCKSTEAEFFRTVTPVATSILYLQGMDEDRFLNSGEIVLRKGELLRCQEKYKAKSFQECARNWLTEFVNNEMVRFRPYVAISYASLIKMVLIHKMDRRPIVEKLRAFEGFLQENMGMKLARESLFASYYFADLLGKMVGVQANSKYEAAKMSLRATAWDIFLLRQPEFLLNPGNLPEMNLAYICTADKKLVEMGNLFEIKMLATRSDGMLSPIPAIEMNYEPFEKKVGESVFECISSLSHENQQKRTLGEQRIILTEEKLRLLVNDLETELHAFCRG